MSESTPILPVILSGGAGSRLWPLSRRDTPKQFLALASERTMIQDTAERFKVEGFLQPVLIANADHVDLIESQLPDHGGIILEPLGRNTAPCAVVAALHAKAHHESALVLLLAADHVVAKPAALREAVSRAVPAARRGRHVTFGITPDHPATGYGYIQRGDSLGGGVFGIESFREKPDAETAARFVDSGAFDWNSGMFLLDPDSVLEEIDRYAPDVSAPATRAYQGAQVDGRVVALDAEHFAQCDSQPIDIALMERTARGAVVPCDIGWEDVGSLRAVRGLHAKGDDTVVRGDGVVVDSARGYIDTDGALVALVGLDNVGVIVRDGRVLVVNLDASQDVKRVVEALKADGRGDKL